ncbi:hypothetical protein Bca101_012381 [Brassica carinata]
MGSCWSDGKGGGGGMVGVGGTTSSAAAGYASPNDAVDYYLKSRGFNGLFSQIELSFSASSLRDRDLTSKSDAMVVVYTKKGRDGTLSELFRSEVVLNSLNPKWIKKLTLSYQFEVVQTLLFRVYDIDTQFQNSREEMLKLDEQQFLGEATCALSEIITKSNRTIALELMRKEGGVAAAQTQPQNHGKLVVHAEESLASKTTTEIVFRKVQKSLADLEKLHLSGEGINLFLPTGVGHKHEDKAIVEVGEVLQFYDSDKRFPAWGFGARPIDIPVSHCFNLNGSSSYCEVDGIQGIMNAYNGALFNVSFAGPTLFGPVINAAATIASESLAQNAKRYYVLLIITDGVITDLQETRDALVSASDLPLSILIVGVGGADYKEMEVIDGDKGERLESSSGRVASRDIVQFVALRDIQYGEVSVVEALLAELPSQFLAYMKNRNITPTTSTTSAS